MKKIQQLSLEELIKYESRLKGIPVGYMIIGLIMISILISIRKADLISLISVAILPVFGLPILLSVLKSVKEEIVKRKQENHSNQY